MKKKILLGVLILAVLSFATACSNGKDNDKSASSVAPTVKPTNSPLPTADVSIKETSDGRSTLNNDTAGYKISYDSQMLKMSNKDNSISFTPADKKDKKDLNIFLNITEMDKESTEELSNQLVNSYKKSIKKKKALLGTAKAEADYYILSDNKDVIHKIYIISSDKKSWYIELKCPSKYKKKYMTSFEEILASMEF